MHETGMPTPTPRSRHARTVLALLALAIWLVTPAAAQTNADKPAPTHAAATYGPHPRQVMDLWLADSPDPTPLAVYIHGGGFVGGSRHSLNAQMLDALLDAGISVAAIEYRLLANAKLPAAHDDAVRAVQKLRANAELLNLDPKRFGGFGGSAGAQLVMYLAMHDDFADPDHAEDFRRQSSRLQAVAPNGGQTTMDERWWFEHIPGYTESHRDFRDAFAVGSDTEFAEVVRSISALDLLSPDDPPIYMTYSMRPGDAVPQNPRRARSWKIHHVVFGTALQDKAHALDVEAHLQYPGASTPYESAAEFLIDKLATPSP
ncbi:MAG: alpha/beta hydrolase [Planctomycetota bacterium]